MYPGLVTRGAARWQKEGKRGDDGGGMEERNADWGRRDYDTAAREATAPNWAGRTLASPPDYAGLFGIVM